MSTRRTHKLLTPVLALVAAGSLLLMGCGEQVEKVQNQASDVADSIAEKGIGAVAEGQWRCDAQVLDGNDSGEPSEYEAPTEQMTVTVAIAQDGRFSVTGERIFGGSGTWAVDGLKLRLSIPWSGDGSNGFYDWTYTADANPPTHLSGRSEYSDQELDVELKSLDKIRLVQADVPGKDGPNYDWDVTCTRTSSDPGPIPPTIPPADADD